MSENRCVRGIGTITLYMESFRYLTIILRNRAEYRLITRPKSGDIPQDFAGLLLYYSTH